MGDIQGLKPVEECSSDPPKAVPTGQSGILKQTKVELQDEDRRENEDLGSVDVVASSVHIRQSGRSLSGV